MQNSGRIIPIEELLRLQQIIPIEELLRLQQSDMQPDPQIMSVQDMLLNQSYLKGILHNKALEGYNKSVKDGMRVAESNAATRVDAEETYLEEAFLNTMAQKLYDRVRHPIKTQKKQSGFLLGIVNKVAGSEVIPMDIFEAEQPENATLAKRPDSWVDWVKTKLPFSGAVQEMVWAGNVWNSLHKIQQGKGEQIDYNTVYDFTKQMENEESRGHLGMIFEGITDLPMYMAEIGMSGGAAGVSKETMSAGLQKLAKEGIGSMLRKSVKAGGEAIVKGSMNAAIIPATTRALAGEMTENIGTDPEGAAHAELKTVGESLPPALIKGWSEIVSEMSGPMLTPWIGAAGRNLGKVVPEKITSAILQRAAKLKVPEGKIADAMKRGAFNGIIEEIGEEEVNAIMSGVMLEIAEEATGKEYSGDEFGTLGGAARTAGHLAKGEYAEAGDEAYKTAAQLGVTAVVSAVPGLAGKGVDVVIKEVTKRNPEAKKKILDTWKKSAVNDPNMLVYAQRLAALAANDTVTRSEFEGILGESAAYLRLNEGERKEFAKEVRDELKAKAELDAVAAEPVETAEEARQHTQKATDDLLGEIDEAAERSKEAVVEEAPVEETTEEVTEPDTYVKKVVEKLLELDDGGHRAKKQRTRLLSNEGVPEAYEAAKAELEAVAKAQQLSTTTDEMQQQQSAPKAEGDITLERARNIIEYGGEKPAEISQQRWDNIVKQVERQFGVKQEPAQKPKAPEALKPKSKREATVPQEAASPYADMSPEEVAKVWAEKTGQNAKFAPGKSSMIAQIEKVELAKELEDTGDDTMQDVVAPAKPQGQPAEEVKAAVDDLLAKIEMPAEQKQDIVNDAQQRLDADVSLVDATRQAVEEAQDGRSKQDSVTATEGHKPRVVETIEDVERELTSLAALSGSTVTRREGSENEVDIVTPDGRKAVVELVEPGSIEERIEAKAAGREALKASKKASGRTGKKAVGSYTYGEGRIRIERNATPDVINHEVVHFAHDIGAISDKEVNEFGEPGKKAYEAVAYAYQNWVLQGRPKNSTLQKIYDLVASILGSTDVKKRQTLRKIDKGNLRAEYNNDINLIRNGDFTVADERTMHEDLNPDTAYGIQEEEQTRDATRVWLEKAYGEKHAEKIMAETFDKGGMARLLNHLHRNRAKYPSLETPSNLVGNSDPTYKVTVDLLGACTRMLRALAVRRYISKNHPTASADLKRAVENELNKKGYGLTCSYCYAFTRRMIALDKLKIMVEALNGGKAQDIIDAMSSTAKLHLKKNPKKVTHWKKAFADAQAEAKANPGWEKDLEKVPEMLRVKSMVDYPRGGAMSTELEKFEEKYPVIAAFRQRATDPGNFKVAQATHAITKQILSLQKKTVDFLKEFGGLRWQSSVDFMDMLVLDYIVGIQHMELSGIPGHIYTKEVDLPLIMNGAGLKFNMSAAPLVINGETQWETGPDGKKRPKMDQGIGSVSWKEVEQAMKADPDHVGVMMLGLNHDIVKWVCTSDSKYANYCIPWHSSGMPSALNKVFSDVKGAVDYKQPHERFIKWDSLNEVPERLRKAIRNVQGKYQVDLTKASLVNKAYKPIEDYYKERLAEATSKSDRAGVQAELDKAPNLPPARIIDQENGTSDRVATEKYLKLCDDLGLGPVHDSDMTSERNGEVIEPGSLPYYWRLKKHYARTDTQFAPPDSSKINYDHAVKVAKRYEKSAVADAFKKGNTSYLEAYQNRKLTETEERDIQAAYEKLKDSNDPMREALATPPVVKVQTLKKSVEMLKKRDMWSTPEQEISSSDTSINSSRLPAAYGKLEKNGVFKRGETWVDIGGGRFDNAVERIKKLGVTLLVFDPFNRTKSHNDKVAKAVMGGQVDNAISNNVLNVIKERANQRGVVMQLFDAVKPGGKAYISVYEGDRSGKGRKTKAGYQHNRKTADYVELIEGVFGDGNVTLSGRAITAEKVESPTVEKSEGLKPKSRSAKRRAATRAARSEARKNLAESADELVRAVKRRPGASAMGLDILTDADVLKKVIKVLDSLAKLGVVEIKAIADTIAEQYGEPAWESMRPVVVQEWLRRQDSPKSVSLEGAGPRGEYQPWYTSETPFKQVEVPELVQFAQKIGAVIRAKGLPKALRGYFKPGLDVSLIAINRAIDNVDQLASTLAHEIGHLIDYLPDSTFARGNILGRVRSVRNYLIGEDGFAEEIRDELIGLSRWWRGDWQSGTSYGDYREKGEELYADAISVLLNSPEQLKFHAPAFYKEFFENLSAKPDVMKQLIEIQYMLMGDSENVAENRSARIQDMFDEANKQWNFAQVSTREHQRSLYQKWVDWWGDNFVDRAFSTKRWARRGLKALGNAVTDAEVARVETAIAHIDELNYADNRNRKLFRDLQERVMDPMNEAEIDRDTFGEYMFLHRIAAGGRFTESDTEEGQNFINEIASQTGISKRELLNPLGHTAKTAQDQKRAIRERMGAEKYAKLEKLSDEFHEVVWECVEEAAEAGVYSQSRLAEMRKDKKNYATFAVIDYLNGTNISAAIHQQVGTLKGVMNPMDATVHKMISLNRWAARNRSLRAVRNIWEVDPMLSKDFEVKRMAPGQHEMRKPPKDFGWIYMHDDGKKIALQVPVEVADAFKRMDQGTLHRLARLTSSASYGIFHPLYISASLGFMVANPFRDIKRAANNLAAEGVTMPGLSMFEVLAHFVKDGIPAGVKDELGLKDEYIEQLRDEKALAVSYADVQSELGEDDNVFDNLAEKYGFMGSEERQHWLKEYLKVWKKEIANAPWYAKHGALVKPLAIISGGFDTASKVAVAKILDKRGYDATKRSMLVRKIAGTPDYKQEGTWTPVLNSALMYSRVRWVGMQHDAGYALGSKGAYPALRWWTSFMLGTILPFVSSYAFYNMLMKMWSDDDDWENAKDKRAFSEHLWKSYAMYGLGWHKNKDGELEAVGLSIPHGDFQRFLISMFHQAIKVTEQATGKEFFYSEDNDTWFREENNDYESVPEVLMDSAREAKQEMIPGYTPILKMIQKWTEYATGGEPRHDMWNEPIFQSYHSDEEQLAKMIDYSVGEMGVAGQLGQYVFGRKFGDKEPLRWYEAPGVSRLVRTHKLANIERSEEYQSKRQKEYDDKQFKSTLPDEANELSSLRNHLNDTSVEKSPEQHAQRKMLNAWWYMHGDPMRQAIKQAEERGLEKEAAAARKQLKDVSKEIVDRGNKAALMKFSDVPEILVPTYTRYFEQLTEEIGKNPPKPKHPRGKPPETQDEYNVRYLAWLDRIIPNKIAAIELGKAQGGDQTGSIAELHYLERGKEIVQKKVKDAETRNLKRFGKN